MLYFEKKKAMLITSTMLGAKQTPDRRERQGTPSHWPSLSRKLALENSPWLALPEVRLLGLTMSFLQDSCDSGCVVLSS